MTFNNEIIFTAVMYLPVKHIGNLDSSISQPLFFWCTLTGTLSVSGLFVLCTFIPGSKKYIERTFAPMELLFRGTFVPGERKVQELSFHGTFAPVERSLHEQLSCVPFNFCSCGTFEVSLPYLKKLWKAGNQCFHRLCWQTFTAV